MRTNCGLWTLDSGLWTERWCGLSGGGGVGWGHQGKAAECEGWRGGCLRADKVDLRGVQRPVQMSQRHHDDVTHSRR